MKPNDKAYEAARSAILKAIAERNCIIAGVPFNENNTDEFDAGEAVEHAKVALDAAYAAQFPPSEDYAGLVKKLRSPAMIFYEYSADKGSIIRKAADALEAVLAERDDWKKTYYFTANKLDHAEEYAKKIGEENEALRTERDALLARLAPVDDKALVEIAAKEMQSAELAYMPAAAIAAIRPHIEAAEREKCAMIADKYEGEWHSDTADACARAIAAAIRSGK